MYFAQVRDRLPVRRPVSIQNRRAVPHLARSRKRPMGGAPRSTTVRSADGEANSPPATPDFPYPHRSYRGAIKMRHSSTTAARRSSVIGNFPFDFKFSLGNINIPATLEKE